MLRDDALQALTREFEARGHELYVVGGSVRDALLGVLEPGAEVDLTTDARPEVIKDVLGPMADSVWDVGAAFGTIGSVFGERTVEITTYRSDVYTHETRKPEVAFGESLEEDLRRRDFTVNSMAIDPRDGRLIDPFGGVKHLAAKVLATPRGAAGSFDEDPLRMLRAARFSGRLGLEPVPDVRAAMQARANRLSIVSPERIRDEFDKIVVLEDMPAAMWLLVDTNVIGEFLPEIPALRVEQDPIHRHKDVLTHTIAVAEKCSRRKVLRLAALFHDVGKPDTRRFGDGGVTFHHHDVVGAKMTRARMRALRYPKDEVDAVSQLVFLHLRVHTYRMGWTDSAVRRYVRDAGPLLDDLNELIRCDCTTRNKDKARRLAARMDDLEERIDELGREEELARLRPALDGNEVMAHLGVGPGRDVGDALKFLMSIRLDEGEIETDDAYARLDVWWAQRQAAASE